IILELEERTFSDFTFVQVTDVHIGYDPRSIERFADALKAIDDLDPKPAFILITGDLVEWNADNFFKAFNGILESNDISTYFIPGNHDRRTCLVCGDDHLANYYEYIQTPYDDYYYTFNHEGYLFVGLDSGEDNDPVYYGDLTPEGSGLGDDQILDLINLGKKDPKIIFMHHPAINDNDDSEELGFFPITDNATGGNDHCIASYRHMFITYCKNYNVRLVLTGHTHKDKIFDAFGKDNLNLRPLFIQTRSATKDDYGFRRIKVASNRASPDPSTATPSYPKAGAVAVGFVNLHAYDSQGRHTGISDGGDTEHDIPESYYTGNYGDTICDGLLPMAQMIMLYNTDDEYRYITTPHTIFRDLKKYEQIENESFNLTITSQTTEGLTTISFYNIPLTENTITTTYINQTTTDYTMEIDT
ncbi:metallophosphoesterase, partial [bacterium]|nr:metallophosphoesterase [bacterium]